MSQLLEIVGPEFEILKMELSDEQFGNYLENGIPDEYSDDYDEFLEELENADGDGGIDCSEIKSIQIYLDGELQQDIIKDENVSLRPTTIWQLGKNYLVRIQSDSTSKYEIVIDSHFDKNKLDFTINQYEIPNKGLISQLSVQYDDNELEYADGSGFSYSEMFFVDKEGNVHKLPA
jgi:hypothetical protein